MRLAGNAGRKKIAKNSPSGHDRTTLSGCIFAAQACIDNRKKNSLNINISPTCPHNMVNFGPLAAEIVYRFVSLGHPANFNGFRVLAALLHGTPAAGVSQTLRRGTRNGSTELSQRAPPMFGRAAIRLGIGPHSSLLFCTVVIKLQHCGKL